MARAIGCCCIDLREGRVRKLAFVKPAGASWPLPLYDLALMTAAECAVQRRVGVELSLVTPEEEPLGISANRQRGDPTAARRERGDAPHEQATAYRSLRVA